MKNKIIITIIMASAFLSCSKKVYAPLTAEVNVVSEEAYKTLELRSIGVGDSEEKANYDSEKKAFEILFFRGIPNSSYEKPLIGSDEVSLLKKHQSYFKTFFFERYKSFVMSAFNASPSQKQNGIYTSVLDIKINTAALKRDLEDQGIIRKFGF